MEPEVSGDVVDVRAKEGTAPAKPAGGGFFKFAGLKAISQKAEKIMENLHSAVGITLGNVGAAPSNQPSSSGDSSKSASLEPADRSRSGPSGRQSSARSLATHPPEDRDGDGIKSDSDMVAEPRAVPTPVPRPEDRRALNWAGDPMTSRQYSTSAPARDPPGKAPSGGSGWWRSQRPQRISVDGEEGQGEGDGNAPGMVSAPVTGCHSNRNSSEMTGPSPRVSPPVSPFPGFDANSVVSVPTVPIPPSAGGGEVPQGVVGGGNQDGRSRSRMPSLDEGIGSANTGPGAGKAAGADARSEPARAGADKSPRMAPAPVADKKKARPGGQQGRGGEPPRRLFVMPSPQGTEGSYSIGDNPDLPWKPRCPAEAPFERELRSHMLGIGRAPERYLHKRAASHLVTMMPAENNMRTAGAVLRVDRNLRAIRFRYVPKRMSEEKFWQRYFTALAIIRHDVMEVHLPGHEHEFCDLCLMQAAQQVSAAAAALAAKEAENDAAAAVTPKGQPGEGDSDEEGMPHADEYVQVMLAVDEEHGAISLQLDVVMVMVEGSHRAPAGPTPDADSSVPAASGNAAASAAGAAYGDNEDGGKGAEPALGHRGSMDVVADVAAVSRGVGEAEGKREAELSRRSQEGVIAEVLAAVNSHAATANADASSGADASAVRGDTGAEGGDPKAPSTHVKPLDKDSDRGTAAAAPALPSLRVSVSNAVNSGSNSRGSRASVSQRSRDAESQGKSAGGGEPAPQGRGRVTRRSSRIDPAAVAQGVGGAGGSSGSAAGAGGGASSGERLQPSMILQRLALALETARSARSMSHLLAQPLDAPPGGPGSSTDGGRGSGTGPLGLGLGSSLSRAVEAALGPFRVAKEAKLAEIEGSVVLAVWELFDNATAAAEGPAGAGAGAAADVKPSGGAAPELTHRKSQDMTRDGISGAMGPTSPAPPLMVAERVNGAPVDGLVAHLAVSMARLTNVAQMARMWEEVVKELRWHWDMGKFLPRVPADEPPDLRYCLLHQQLMLINACVARRHRRAKALAALEAARAEAAARASAEGEGAARLASAAAAPSAANTLATPFTGERADGGDRVAAADASSKQGDGAASLVSTDTVTSTVTSGGGVRSGAVTAGGASDLPAGNGASMGASESTFSESDLMSLWTGGDATPSTAGTVDSSHWPLAQPHPFQPTKSVSEPIAPLDSFGTPPQARHTTLSSQPSLPEEGDGAGALRVGLETAVSEPLIPPPSHSPLGADVPPLMLDASVRSQSSGVGGGAEEDSVRSINLITLASPVGPQGGMPSRGVATKGASSASASTSSSAAASGLPRPMASGTAPAPAPATPSAPLDLGPLSLLDDPMVAAGSNYGSRLHWASIAAPVAGTSSPAPASTTPGAVTTATDVADDAKSAEAKSTTDVFFSLEDGELQRQTVAFDPLEELMPVHLLAPTPLAPQPLMPPTSGPLDPLVPGPLAPLAPGLVSSNGPDLPDSINASMPAAADVTAAGIQGDPQTQGSAAPFCGCVASDVRKLVAGMTAGSAVGMAAPGSEPLTAASGDKGNEAVSSGSKGGSGGGAPVFAGSGLPLRGALSFEEDAQRQPEGVAGLVKDLVLLKTGVPMNKPETQECAILTEEMMRETEEMLMRTGSVGPGCKQLLADMEAFKAANPGCVLEDFVRWYSPPDWIEDPSPRASSDDGIMGGCRHGDAAVGSARECCWCAASSGPSCAASNPHVRCSLVVAATSTTTPGNGHSLPLSSATTDAISTAPQAATPDPVLPLAEVPRVGPSGEGDGQAAPLQAGVPTWAFPVSVDASAGQADVGGSTACTLPLSGQVASGATPGGLTSAFAAETVVSVRLDVVLAGALGVASTVATAAVVGAEASAADGGNPARGGDGARGSVAAPGVKLPRGRLSARMQEQDNLWCQLWDSARPIPAYKQSPLFDAEHAGESTITLLEHIAPSDLFEQLFFTALGCAFTAASTTLLSIVESEKQRQAKRTQRAAASDDAADASSSSTTYPPGGTGGAATDAAEPGTDPSAATETPKSPFKSARAVGGPGAGSQQIRPSGQGQGQGHQQSASGLAALKDLLRDACAYAEVSCVRGMGSGKIDSLCQVYEQVEISLLSYALKKKMGQEAEAADEGWTVV